MESISHHQMRNDSAEVSRRVAAGETLVVTKNGLPAAVIGPPPDGTLADLASRGRLREALKPAASLLTIPRAKAGRPTAEIVRDTRGPW